MKIKIDTHIKLRNKLSVFVKCNYADKQALEIIHSFGRKYYHTDAKMWELPIDAFKVIVSNYTGQLDILGELPKDLEYFLNLLDMYDNLDLDYCSKTKPYEYQTVSYNFSKNHSKFLLGDEQGLGKTKQSIDIAVSRSNKMQHCLIVCGVNELKWNWVKEIEIHSDKKGYILGTRRNKRGKQYIGSVKERLADLQSINTIEEYFIITNIETLRDSHIQAEIGKLCDLGIIGMTIIDEIHKCKNSTSIQGKSIHYCRSYYKLALTGTPLMNDAIDLYNILKWLEVENHTLSQFKSHYCDLGGFGGYEIIGYKNMDELQSKLDSVMLRRRKNEVLDLPDKIYIDEYLDMDNKQWQIYNEIKQGIMDNIDKIMLNPNPLVELTRLRQCTSYPKQLTSKDVNSAKLNRAYEIVEEVTQNGGKCIIFSNWTSDINPLFEKLKQFNPAIATGDVKCVDDEITKFKTVDSCRVIVGTIGVLGTGFTLTEAETVIFLNEPWNRAIKDQAEDRAHRIGTKNTVNIITLLCRDTIDEKIHQLVKTKGELSDTIVDKQDINFFIE